MMNMQYLVVTPMGSLIYICEEKKIQNIVSKELDKEENIPNCPLYVWFKKQANIP